MTRLKAFIARHPVATYFSLTFVISWGGALLAIGGSGAMRGTTPTSDVRFAHALIAMLAGPSLAGTLLTALVYGRTGLREFLSRLLTWQVGSIRYAVALLTAPVVMTMTLLALSSVSPGFLPGIFTSDDRRSLLLVSLTVGLSAGIFEELGWTGFAIPMLRRRYGVLATGLIVGILWSAWHLLPNVWASHAASGELSLPLYFAGTAVGVFVGYLTAFRVLMVWFYDHTHSLFVAMLMHVSLTASLLILNPLGISGANLLVFSFTFAAAVWVVVVVITSRGRWHLERRPLRSSRRAASAGQEGLTSCIRVIARDAVRRVH
jgi:membrane protease YdiL (CAAX protease family)